MSDMSTLTHGARLVATEAPRTDARGAKGAPASHRQPGGKTLPPNAGASPGRQVREVEAAQEQRVQQAITRLNDYVQSFQRDLRFSVDGELGEPVVEVIDSSTNEVIRQIPSEVALRLARNLNAKQEQILSERLGGTEGSSGRLGLINTKI